MGLFSKYRRSDRLHTRTAAPAGYRVRLEKLEERVALAGDLVDSYYLLSFSDVASDEASTWVLTPTSVSQDYSGIGALGLEPSISMTDELDADTNLFVVRLESLLDQGKFEFRLPLLSNQPSMVTFHGKAFYSSRAELYQSDSTTNGLDILGGVSDSSNFNSGLVVLTDPEGTVVAIGESLPVLRIPLVMDSRSSQEGGLVDLPATLATVSRLPGEQSIQYQVTSQGAVESVSDAPLDVKLESQPQAREMALEVALLEVSRELQHETKLALHSRSVEQTEAPAPSSEKPVRATSEPQASIPAKGVRQVSFATDASWVSRDAAFASFAADGTGNYEFGEEFVEPASLGGLLLDEPKGDPYSLGASLAQSLDQKKTWPMLIAFAAGPFWYEHRRRKAAARTLFRPQGNTDSQS